MSEPIPILAVQDLSLSLGGKEILRDVSFQVGEGEWVAVIGPNGAGKSTLLKCVVRVHPGGKGNILLRGMDLANCSQRDLARVLAYVPQLEEGGNPFTVEEFVLLGRYPHLTPFSSVSPRDRMAVARSLALTRMEPFARRTMETLSGGERQKASIAAALAQEASLLLLDEPTAFLDPRHQEEVLDLLSRLNREEGTAVLSVTHDVNAASRHASRVLALKEGRTVWWGAAEDLMDGAVLAVIYDKVFRFAAHPVDGRPLAVP